MRSGMIAPGEAVTARAAATEVAGWLDSGVEPFGQVGWEKLRDAIHRGVAPLRWLPDASSEH